MRRTFLSGVAFPAIVWGLAVHSLIMAILFGYVGLPADVVRLIAAWKEAVMVILVLVVAVRAISGSGAQVTVAAVDVWIVALIATALAYLIGENALLMTGLPKAAELLGLRDGIYFLLIYFVGRATPELIDDDRTLKTIYALVVFTCIIGILEPFIVPPEALVAVGVASYFQDFLGITNGTAGNDFGLPANYWTLIGGRQFRRAGSIYLSGQGFAVPFLLFFPLVMAWVFLRQKVSAGKVVGFVIVCAGVLMTVTRMTVLIVLVQMLLFVAMRRRPEWVVAGLGMAGLVFAGAFILIPGFPTFVWQTLSWQTGSNVSHSADWSNGVAAFASHPWGMGLGTTDQASVRSGLPYITGDNLYLKYAVEMGVLGIVLLVLILGSIVSHALRLYRAGATDNQRRMGLAMWLATIGLIINAMTAVVFNSPILAWLFFWLAGAVVTCSQRVAVQGREPGSMTVQAAPSL